MDLKTREIEKSDFIRATRLIKSKLRESYSYTPLRTIARQRARIGPTIYLCAGCELACCERESGSTEQERESYAKAGVKLIDMEMEVDHIDPVESLDGEWKGWEIHINKLIFDPLFDITKLQVLCKCCHYLKTQWEEYERKEAKSK